MRDETGIEIEDKIHLHEIFSSIQGEGSMTGTPMTFIRLWGCNLSCLFCDTPQTNEDRQETTVRAITATAYALGNKWVCITGGEPTIQANFGALVRALQSAGLKVAIETNGTRPFWAMPDWICVSPKTGCVYDFALERADEIKVLVGSGLYDAVEYIDGHLDLLSKMCLQPVYQGKFGKQPNLQQAIELCHRYQVRLSIQLHKYIGVK